MTDQYEISEGHVIAIWLGDFTSYDDLDDYIQHSFSNDFGFILNERKLPEISEPDGQEIPVRDLLTGFSFWKDWIEDAVRLCQETGWTSAKGAAVFYHLRYRPELCLNPNARLKFAANVPWNPKE